MSGPRTVPAISVGCGLLCEVTAQLEGHTVTIDGGCPHAAAWLGDGAVPDRILVDGKPASFEAAMQAATELLVSAHGNVRLHAGPGLSVEAIRPVVGLADALNGDVATETSVGAAQAIVAGQRRGRAAATLGELANRADVVLCWGTGEAWMPCVRARVVDRAGTHVPGGRRDRTVIQVRIGQDGTTTGADIAGTLAPADELLALSFLRAGAQGHALAAPADAPFLARIAERLAGARYVGIIAPAEDGDPTRSPERSESLIALAQALNGPARAALLSLRSGGNRTGAEAVLTWQTGYPVGVSFRGGVPGYDPATVARAATPVDATLMAGDWRDLGALPQNAIVVGPRASTARGARVAIDTGILGVHEGGTVYRADDVPLVVPVLLDGARTAAVTLAALEHSVGRALRSAAA